MADSGLEHFDCAGNPIRQGNWVCYSALDGRSGVLRFGYVNRLVEPRVVRNSQGYEEEKDTTPVRVLAYYLHHGWNRMDSEGRPLDPKDWTRSAVWERLKNGKEVALGFPSRMLVVPYAMIPKQIKELFNDQRGT